jgi:hypothetical protein
MVLDDFTSHFIVVMMYNRDASNDTTKTGCPIREVITQKQAPNSSSRNLKAEPKLQPKRRVEKKQRHDAAAE